MLRRLAAASCIAPTPRRDGPGTASPGTASPADAGLVAGQPHSDLDVAVAVPGHLGQAQTPVKRLGAVVDREHLKDEVVALLPCLGGQRADEAGADAAALVTGMDFDAG